MVESDVQLTVSVVSVLLFREQEAVGYRSNFVSFNDPELDIDPICVPPQLTSRVIDADMPIVFDPSESCGIVIVLERRVRSPLPPMVPLQLYVVPFMVMLAVFVAVDWTA
jgi:hypothetical protein